jgi:hypothetical protein
MNKYQWPASRLDEEEMALLFHEKQRTKKSICELLRLAVHAAYGETSNKVEYHINEKGGSNGY